MNYIKTIFLVCFLLSSFLVQAKVICASPRGAGDSTSEASGDVSPVCNPENQNAPDGSVQRDVNLALVVDNVTGQGVDASTSAPEPTREGSSGSQQ